LSGVTSKPGRANFPGRLTKKKRQKNQKGIGLLSVKPQKADRPIREKRKMGKGHEGGEANLSLLGTCGHGGKALSEEKGGLQNRQWPELVQIRRKRLKKKEKKKKVGHARQKMIGERGFKGGGTQAGVLLFGKKFGPENTKEQEPPKGELDMEQ